MIERIKVLITKAAWKWVLKYPFYTTTEASFGLHISNDKIVFVRKYTGENVPGIYVFYDGHGFYKANNYEEMIIGILLSLSRKKFNK